MSVALVAVDALALSVDGCLVEGAYVAQSIGVLQLLRSAVLDTKAVHF